MEQVPAAMMVTVPLKTVHTDDVVEAKPTVRFEVAVALIVKGATPNVTLLKAPKEIVCASKPS
jgi:hypothetical protein